MLKKTFSIFPNQYQTKVPSIKIAYSSLRTLKALSTREHPKVSLIKLFFTCLRELTSFTWILPAKLNNNMCKNYGHVIRGSWTEGWPNCSSCGMTITSLKSLRTAYPRT